MPGDLTPFHSDPFLIAYHVYRVRYDDAVRAVYRFYNKSWANIAFAIEMALPDFFAPGNHAEVVKRYCLDRRLPLAYACVLVKQLKGQITLFDFFPYLFDYIDHIPTQELPACATVSEHRSSRSTASRSSKRRRARQRPR